MKSFETVALCGALLLVGQSQATNIYKYLNPAGAGGGMFGPIKNRLAQVKSQQDTSTTDGTVTLDDGTTTSTDGIVLEA